MKRFLLILVFLSFNIQAQKDNSVKKTDSAFVCVDTINGVKIFKKVLKSEVKKTDFVLKQTPSEVKNTNTNIEVIPDINNVQLTDLPQAKRYDSLWYKSLYQPILFDSIQALTKNVVVSFEKIKLDTILLKQQLKLLNQKTQLDIVYHPALVQTIQSFLKNRKKSLARLFKMAEYYFPIFEEKLAKYDIPLEMKYLAIVESALNPRAVSPAGAGGLWQFMYSTGKMYDLEINNYVDERFDPIKETEAACNHMQDLYKVFKDWNLVLAAYNSGAGNVTKAIRRSGGYKNYWNIRPYLPRETASYVPLFQATLFLGEYANEYGLKTDDEKPFHYIPTDTIQVRHSISFEQVSKLLKMPVDELEFLNPQYKLDIVPYVEDRHYTLKLPLNLVGVFVNNENLIYQIVEKEFNKKEKPLPKFYKFNNYIVYRVRQGDYLGKIARRYHVGVSKIKRWNHLRSNRLRIGQKLRIYSRYAIATSSRKSKPKRHSKKQHSKSKKYITYKVKAGDTLWNISRKYQIAISDILRWNKLKKSDKLKPGMHLKIYKS